MKESISVEKLAKEYASKSLNELSEMKAAIDLATKLIADKRKDTVPAEEAEELKAAWKFASTKLKVTFPVEVTIAVKADSSDPCAVYPYIECPAYMVSWDAYELLDDHPEHREAVEKNVEDIKERLEKADKVYYRIQNKYGVPGYVLLSDS